MRIAVTLSRKLIFLVIMAGLFAFTITGYISFESATNIITTNTQNHLKSESNTHGSALRTIIETRVIQNNMLGSDPVIRESINDLSDIPGLLLDSARAEYRTTFLNQIREFEANVGYSTVISGINIYDNDGSEIFTLHPEHKPVDDRIYYQRSLDGPFIDFERDEDDSTTTLVIATQIFQNGAVGVLDERQDIGRQYLVRPLDAVESEWIGTMITRIPFSIIDDLILARSGLGDMGEVFIVDRDGHIMNQVKFIDRTEQQTTVDNIAVTECLDNNVVYSGIYASYRGAVHGSSYCASDLGFVLLAEIDRDEVEEPIVTLQINILQTGTAIMFGMIGLAFLVSRTVSKPILRIKNMANEVAGGNFDIRTEIKTKDEVGELAAAFDTMTHKLRESMIRIKEKEGIIRQQEGVLLQFSNHSEKYCVGMVDIMNSTKTCSQMTDTQISEFYKIFINSMGLVIQKYEGTIVKNIGDALLFYFSIYGHDEKQILRKCLDCCLAMGEIHDRINRKLNKAELPPMNYRISATYGIVRIAKSLTSTVEDIFGTTVNRCAKINRSATANGLIIGEYFYEVVKDFEEYSFSKMDSSEVSAEHGYSGYIVTKKVVSDPLRITSNKRES